jgi:membrane protease YdiL (CAAX protease family)
MTHTKNNTPTIIGGILLMFILISTVPFFGKLFYLPEKHYSVQIFLSRIYIWIVLAIVMLYSKKIEHQPLLLWKEEKYPLKKNILFALSIIGVLMILLIFSGLLLKILEIQSNSSKANLVIRTLKSNILLLVFTCITAGITEELLFRAYLLPRLIRLSKSVVFAIIFSAILFAIIHIGWGTWAQIVSPFLIGLVFAVFYWKYRSIKFLIVFHFLWDFITILFFSK